MSNHKISRKPLKILLALLVLSITGGTVWYFLIRTPPAPANVIKLSGRIEGLML